MINPATATVSCLILPLSELRISIPYLFRSIAPKRKPKAIPIIIHHMMVEKDKTSFFSGSGFI